MNPSNETPRTDSTPLTPAPSTPENTPPAAPASEGTPIPVTTTTPASTPLVQPNQAPTADKIENTYEPVSETVAPVTSKKSPVRKIIIGLLTVTVIVLLFVAGFFFWQMSQPLDNSETTESVSPQTSQSVDSAEDVESEVEGISTELDTLDSSEFEDATLDDAALAE